MSCHLSPGTDSPPCSGPGYPWPPRCRMATCRPASRTAARPGPTLLQDSMYYLVVRSSQHSSPVHGEAVVLGAQDLGRDVVGRAAEGGGGVAGADALLAHAVVGELDVALVVEQHVVQLEVAVDDAALVQIVQGQADLRAVEPRMLLGKPK